MQGEIDFHERFCLKTHPRIALGVAAFCALELALVARFLFRYASSPYPMPPAIDEFFRVTGSLFTIFIAYGIFRDAKCTSEKVIIGAFALSIALGLFKIWGAVPVRTVEAIKLGLYMIALRLAVLEFRSAHSRP